MTNEEKQPCLHVRKVDYGRYGLRGNPFPMSGVATPHTPYPLIDPRMDRQVHDFIDDTLRAREYCGLAILGDYGSGKTYALRYIEALLGSIDTVADVQEVMAIYVDRPKGTLGSLVAEVCDRIGRARLQNFLLEVVLTDLAQARARKGPEDQARLSSLSNAYQRIHNADLFKTDSPLTLLHLDAIMNPVATVDRVRAATGDVEFLSEFAGQSIYALFDQRDQSKRDVAKHLACFALASEHKSPELWNLFINGNIRISGRFVRSISPKDVWSCVMSLLLRAGYIMVYWLVDEFEELETDRKHLTSLREFLADFRDLIDANLNNFALVLAGKNSTWDVYARIHPAFVQRFARIVPLPANSAAEFEAMIKERLAAVRQKEYVGDPLLPFTADAISGIQRISGGNVRVAVQMCHIMLWYVALNNTPVITSQMVASVGDIHSSFVHAGAGRVFTDARGATKNGV